MFLKVRCHITRRIKLSYLSIEFAVCTDKLNQPHNHISSTIGRLNQGDPFWWLVPTCIGTYLNSQDQYSQIWLRILRKLFNFYQKKKSFAIHILRDLSQYFATFKMLLRQSLGILMRKCRDFLAWRVSCFVDLNSKWYQSLSKWDNWRRGRRVR